MPYVSDAQRKFMHAEHPKIAKKWDAEFPNQKGLPEHHHSTASAPHYLHSGEHHMPHVRTATAAGIYPACAGEEPTPSGNFGAA